MQFYADYSSTQKKYFRYGAFAALFGIIVALFSLAYAYVADGKAKLHTQETSSIAITGEGKVSAKPDIAIVNATIVTEKVTVSEAQSKNTESYNAIIKFLEKTGVVDKDVKTTAYTIYPQYFYSQNKKPEITGYQVRNTLEIKIRDLSKVDDVLGGLVENGANEIGNVSFTIENPNVLKEQARKLAIDMAKEKAQVLSGDLGVRLSRITSFSESEAGVPTPIYYSDVAGKGGMGGGGGPDLSQGEQEVKVLVTLTYEFEAR